MEGYTHLNGSKTSKSNFVWGAALTLAWKQLCKQIIKQPIKINSDNKQALAITQNFNKSSCQFGMLSPDCYYARAGFGNKTVHLINEQVKKKFPEKKTDPVVANLQDDSIISYAYFFKKLLFDNPFTKKQVHFNGKPVSGFVAKTKEQRQQVRVHEYHDEDNFLIQLKTKAKNDHIFLFKTTKNLEPQQVLQKIGSTKQLSKQDIIHQSDSFEAPIISLKHKRSVKELLGVFLANQKFKQYFFSEIYQIINFDLDETGVKVENEGVIKMLRSAVPMVTRRFVLDKPFWIVMREKKEHPYFVAHINDIFDDGKDSKL